MQASTQENDFLLSRSVFIVFPRLLSPYELAEITVGIEPHIFGLRFLMRYFARPSKQETTSTCVCAREKGRKRELATFFSHVSLGHPYFIPYLYSVSSCEFSFPAFHGGRVSKLQSCKGLDERRTRENDEGNECYDEGKCSFDLRGHVGNTRVMGKVSEDFIRGRRRNQRSHRSQGVVAIFENVYTHAGLLVARKSCDDC